MLPLDAAGHAPAPSTAAPAGSRGTGSRILLPPRVVAREFSRLFREHGVTAHPAEVRRLASRFVAAGHDRLEDVEAYVIAYADPTGETAVRNVMRGGPDAS
jgi:hypothetical protein